MSEIRERGSVSDETYDLDDVLAYQYCPPQGPRITKAERKVLRRLAGEVAELAARPVEAEKRALWAKHNALEKTRPLIFCKPENGWKEILPDKDLVCESPLTRRWELRLRKEIFWGSRMRDDYTIRPGFDVPHVYDPFDWGLRETRIHNEAGWCYAWDAPVKTEDDLEALHFPTIDVDFAATERIRSAADDLLGDLLPVRVKTIWWWSTVTTKKLAELRGAQQIMYDMYRDPDLLHRIMGFLRDGTTAMLDELEDRDLLSLNNDGTYVGSGGLGWSDELPQPDFADKVRCEDMWGHSESQETAGVGPEMYAEFVFAYQKPALERFGLNCYGCCEALHSRWHIIEEFPNLRRISVSPWADKAMMAERLKDKYIYSAKPQPSYLAMDSFEEEAARAELREIFSVTRDCCVEVIMKDNHTIRNDPERVIRWVEIAREEAERF